MLKLAGSLECANVKGWGSTGWVMAGREGECVSGRAIVGAAGHDGAFCSAASVAARAGGIGVAPGARSVGGAAMMRGRLTHLPFEGPFVVATKAEPVHDGLAISGRPDQATHLKIYRQGQ